MKRFILLLLLSISTCFSLSAQMFVGADTLYGNEWIDFSKTYYKIKISDDGLYRLSGSTLINAGIPAGSVNGSDWRLYKNGVQIPIYVSSQGPLEPSQWIEFWAEKNRSEIDFHLFDAPDEEMLNPWYSMFNDTAACFLVAQPAVPALRIQEAGNDLVNPPAAEAFVWRTDAVFFTNAFVKRDIANEIRYSWFNGDGWSRGGAVATAVDFAPQQLYNAGPATARVRVRYAANLGAHQQQLLLHDSLYAQDDFVNWKIVDRSFETPIAKFTPNLSIKINGLAGNTDRNLLAGYEVRYPASPNFPGAHSARFQLEAQPAGHYLEIGGFHLGAGAPVAYDRTLQLRIVTQIQDNKALLRLPPVSAERQVVLVSPSAQGMREITQLKAVQFHNYAADEKADFIIISNPALYSDPQNNGANHVADYADYRRSAAGGNHRVAVVDVNELYEQFAYGIRFHPISIRNFCHYIYQVWEQPKHLLFIGKALGYNTFRSASQQQLFIDSLYYVPMYGVPAVDQSFVMRRGGLSKPLMSVGRIPARQPRQIKDYLDKLIEHEAVQRNAAQTLEDRAWMKRVIHISGGNAGEQAIIRNYTEDMAAELRNNRYGADIHSFYKTSNDPVQNDAYSEMSGLVKEGVALWMVYGHSSRTVVDYDIGAAGSYKNGPKYPYLMVMGCQAGDCATPTRSLGEEYVLEPKSGAIAFTASSNFSYIDGLHSYGKRFYERLGGPDFGKTLGEVAQATIESLVGSNYPSLVAILHQNVLQGDPALYLLQAPGPDYVIDPKTVAFHPNPIATDQADYSVSFDVVNLGENTAQAVDLKLERRGPDNVLSTIWKDTLAAPAFRSKTTLSLPNVGAKAGFNRFFLTVDSDNAVEEQPAAAEFNNQLLSLSGETGVEVYFYTNDIQPVFPPDFAIVSQPQVTLSASALSNTNQPIRYLFQADTLETFNSPFLKTAEKIQAGGLIQWKPEFNLKDSTVLYWRVARDSIVNGQIPWHTRSFVYLNGSAPGWNQSNFGQFKSNTLSNLVAKDSSRSLEFVDNANYVLVKIQYRDGQSFPGLNNGYYEGLLSQYQWGMVGVTKGLTLMVHDPASGRVIYNPPGAPFNPAPSARRFFFHFNTADSLHRIGLMQFIENEIPEGAVVGLLGVNYSNDQQGYDPENWGKDSLSYGKNLFQVFESLGAKYVRDLATYTGVPPGYGFIFKKGDPAFAIDTIMDTPGDIAEIRRDFKGRWFFGESATERIGPAKAWKSLHFLPKAGDNPSDEATLQLYGERPDRSDTLLLSLRAAADTALTAWSASDYPYLKLKYATLDTIDRSPVPLAYTRVLFDPLPEGALNPTQLFEFFADTLQEGQTLRTRIAFANISNVDFKDTVLVKYRIENPAGNGIVRTQRLRPLPAGDTLQTWLDLNTTQLRGPQRLLIDVNPDQHQPEAYHFNNVAFRSFFVSRDQRNPLLDVTFDGAHLMDGDLISPKPEIMISLRDDNRYLAMSDTALFNIKVLYPDGQERLLAFNHPDIVFIPAEEGQLNKKNEARIEWRPHFEQDGDYQLLVQGRDMSGNTSADIQYSIRYKVINRSSISHLLNYPNPFSTSTCFYYTMTGAETPVHFKLQIMTVSGKVVREVTEAEFGPLRAGVHQSQFCWDGKDAFGDQLANGVYLYRISARKADGSAFEFFENNAIDGYFKGGFGKMVLMR